MFDNEVEGEGVGRAVFGGELFEQLDGVVEVGGEAEGADGDVGGGGVGRNGGGEHKIKGLVDRGESGGMGMGMGEEDVEGGAVGGEGREGFGDVVEE